MYHDIEILGEGYNEYWGFDDYDPYDPFSEDSESVLVGYDDSGRPIYVGREAGSKYV